MLIRLFFEFDLLAIYQNIKTVNILEETNGVTEVVKKEEKVKLVKKLHLLRGHAV